MTLTWLAEHELRLGWRDWVALMTAGRRKRARTVVVALLVVAALMHLLAYSMIARYLAQGANPDKATLVVVTGTLILSWSLVLSQAMESVTRAFYSRADLDLILTSPVPARKIFAVRIGRIAVSVAAVAVILAAPFIDVAAVVGGPRWLGAYGMVAAMGMAAAAVAVASTVALFHLVGPKRTRFIAQVMAAVVGASFVIGLQVVAILSYGSMSRFAPLQSEWMVAHAPAVDSALWWPAHAVLGDPVALAVVAVASLALLGLSIAAFAGRFGDYVEAAAGVSNTIIRQPRWRRSFRRRSAASVLRHKEWTLLWRDPWLMSQTLMQILYLVPPAVMLWRSFGDTGALVVLVPVVVMAAGQLAGGLAWLSISGEDAPDLVATAPISAQRLIWAKIEAVMGAIATIFAPLIVALALASPTSALVAMLGVAIAAASATFVQLCFRAQARRSQFRRRHTSSRIATIAEATSSVAWAGAAALIVVESWLALFPALFALAILAGVRFVVPRAAYNYAASLPEDAALRGTNRSLASASWTPESPAS